MEIKITNTEIQFPSMEKSFPQNTTISVAANMRDALKDTDGIGKEEVTVVVNSPVVTVPQEQLEEEDATALYNLTVSATDEEIIVVQQYVKALKVVALFAVSKDLKTVIEDNFKKYEFKHVGINELEEAVPTNDNSAKEGVAKILSLKNQSLIVFLYDNIMYAYALKQNRLNFFNRYEATSAHDCAYILLSVWKQLGYSQLKDELVLTGESLLMDDLRELLGEFIKKVK